MKNIASYFYKIISVIIFMSFMQRLPAVIPVQNQENELEHFSKKVEQKRLSLKEKIALKFLKRKINRIQKRNAKIVSKEKKPIQPLAVLSLIAALIGVAAIPASGLLVTTVGMLTALLMSIISLVKFKNKPGEFRGRNAAVAAVIISSIFIGIGIYLLASSVQS